MSPQAEHAGNGNASAVHAERAWSFSASSPQAVAVASKAARALRVELRTARMATVEVELSPDAGAGLEVHGLVAAPALAAPPITDVTIAVIDGGIAIGLGSVEHHPAGTYTGAVIAAGRACGTLTVRLS